MWGGSAQSVTGSYSQQQTDLGGAGAVLVGGSRTSSAVACWQSSVTTALFVNVSGNYIDSRVAGTKSSVGSVGPGVTLVLFGGRAQASSQVQWTETRVPGIGTDRDLAPNLDLRYLVTGHQMLVFRAGFRRFRTGGTSAGDFDERRATLQYSASM
jgi:hypothetical protein